MLRGLARRDEHEARLIGGPGLAQAQADGHGGELTYSMFEADGARRVFPCHDVPADKATWQLTLDVPKEALKDAPGFDKERMG